MVLFAGVVYCTRKCSNEEMYIYKIVSFTFISTYYMICETLLSLFCNYNDIIMCIIII